MRKVLLLVSFIAATLTSFTQDPVKLFKGPRPVINLDAVPDQAMEKGRISIKFKKEFESFLKANPLKGSDGFIRFDIPAVDELNVKYKVSKSGRAFDQILNDARYDERHKLWGFNRWYQLEFPADVDIKTIVKAYSRLSNFIEVSEPVYTITRYNQVTEYKKPGIYETPAAPFGVNFVPNDTRYNEQWHYSNSGQAGGTSGKDIKLPQAWDLEKGKAGVIVSIIDGGIDITHPDIAPHMWPTNGFNFVNNTTTLDADPHGTHTAGTVGAVSHNGVGVSGVAGGDGSAGSGVRLMSLEVFGPSSSAANFGAPFIWAADRGAMIAQNSWGYTQPNVFQQIVLDGIDYFIANGGGAVLKGGLVIFAAGNNNQELAYYPGYYEKVFAVASTNNRDVRAGYSNFGTYVDISAPGGEQAFTNDPAGVLSTVTVAGGSYAFFQGTSMACPHVSGVASLLASRAPGRFSNDDIKAIIMATVDNHYPDNLSTYAGKLGAGRLNAFKALQKTEELIALPPVESVTGFSSALNCPNVQLNWTKNAASNDVLIAYSLNANFGLPSGSYAAGDPIPGGGVVIYKGPASNLTQGAPKDSASVTFKIWSVTAANVYSAGLLTNLKVPFSISTFTGNNVGTNNILSWTKNCSNNDVLILHSTTGAFGVPSGNLSVGQTIPGGGTVIYKGSALTASHANPPNGTNYYRIIPINPNNVYSDFWKDVSICVGSIAGPVVEGFESTTFPPAGWRLINPNTGSISWERTTRAAKTGAASALMRFYDYSIQGHIDYLLSPSITTGTADSIIVSFDLAYKAYYQANYEDSLELVISNDCGSTYTSVWKRGGAQLSTSPGTASGSYTPVAADWQNLRFDVRALVGNASSFLIGFKAINKYGENLYIDNVNIYTVENGRRDAAITQVIEPSPKLCSRNFTPKIQLRNLGKDTLKTVKIMYRFNTNALDSVVWNGSLPIGTTALVDLKAVALGSGGNYLFTVYTKDPNGLADQINSNDTMKVNLTVFDPQPDPVKEGFEQTTFPPANWFVASSGSAYTWERNSRGTSSEKTASAWIRNYRFNSGNKKDDLYSPLVQVASPDSVYLKFDVAHVTAKFPGSTGVPLDTLEVLLTTDCGKTLRSVYKKWGEDLSTVDKNFPIIYTATDTVGFVPNSKNQWRTEWIDVSRFVPANSKFQFVFRSTSNKGNNIFLDNIDISTVVLPAKLKQAGYLISPNPFDGFFTVRHLLPPANLRAIRVTNSSGQMVAARSYNGNASNYITIDMSRYASGLYNVELIYTDNRVRQTIIKRQ